MRGIKIIVLVVLFLPLGLMAQKARVWNKPLYDSYQFHFGFSFSLGILDFSVNHSKAFNQFDSVYSVTGISKPIFGVNVVSNLKLTDNLDLRFIPGLSFGQRNLIYEVTTDGGNTFHHYDRQIESTLLQFPLLLKYRAVRQNNYRPYLIAGVNYTLDLATRKKVAEEEIVKTRLKKHDILIEAGFGVDSYLPFFKFTTELKFSYGLLNMVDYDGTQYTQVFSRLGTKMVTLAIFFE